MWEQHQNMLEKSGIKIFKEFKHFLEDGYKDGLIYSEPNIINEEDDITDDINLIMTIIATTFQKNDEYKLIYTGDSIEKYNYGHKMLFQHFEKHFIDGTVKKVNRVFSQKERNRGLSGISKFNLINLIDSGTLEIIDKSSEYKREIRIINGKVYQNSLSSFRVNEAELQDFNTDIKKVKYNDPDDYNLKLLKSFESTNDIEPLKKRIRSTIGGVRRLNWCNTNIYYNRHILIRKLPYRYND